MESELFRTEVADARRQDVLGRINIAIPTSRWVFSVLAVVLALSLVGYVCVGHYTRTAKVSGVLVPTAGVIALDATGQGQVVRTLVRQGDSVERGQILVEFHNPVDSASLGNTRAIIARQLASQRDGYKSDLETQKTLSESQGQALRGRIELMRAQKKQIEEQLDLQNREAESQRQRYEKIAPLAGRGYVSSSEAEQYHATLLNSELQVRTLRRQQLDLEQQLTEVQQQLTNIPLDLSAQYTATRSRLADIEQALAQNESQRAWVLRAPCAGVVSALLVKPGQAVTAGRPLLSILPRGSALEAQLQVPSQAIGFITPGQRVVLRYAAFPYQKFGQYFGTVKDISSSALSPEQFDDLGQKVEGTGYRVIVKLDQQDISSYGRATHLMPGMALDADIQLDRRRLIEWIFEPILGFGRRMIETPRSGTGQSHA